MNRFEAHSVLKEQLAAFARQSYLEVAGLIDNPTAITVKAPAGRKYQVEFNVFYDSEACRDLRIIGSIDNGGLRAFVPVTKTLIMKQNGETL
jgi:hypothetical protein